MYHHGQVRHTWRAAVDRRLQDRQKSMLVIWIFILFRLFLLHDCPTEPLLRNIYRHQLSTASLSRVGLNMSKVARKYTMFPPRTADLYIPLPGHIAERHVPRHVHNKITEPPWTYAALHAFLLAGWQLWWSTNVSLQSVQYTKSISLVQQSSMISVYKLHVYICIGVAHINANATLYSQTQSAVWVRVQDST